MARITEQYINEANAVRENRRTYKSQRLPARNSRSLAGHQHHRAGQGPEAAITASFSFDLDRHTYIDPQQFVAYVLSVHAFLVKNLPNFAIVAQVNPKNGSTVFFCFFPSPEGTRPRFRRLSTRLDAKAKKDIPGYTTPEIYPVFGPGKVYLPFNPEKITLGDMGLWPKIRTKNTKKCSPMVVYSLANFPDYVKSSKKAAADAIKLAILTACQQPMSGKKAKKKPFLRQEELNGTGRHGCGAEVPWQISANDGGLLPRQVRAGGRHYWEVPDAVGQDHRHRGRLLGF